MGLEGWGGAVRAAGLAKEGGVWEVLCEARECAQPQEESAGHSGWVRGTPREGSAARGFWSWGIARARLQTCCMTPLPSRKADPDLVPILQTRRRRLREVLPLGAGCSLRVGPGARR